MRAELLHSMWDLNSLARDQTHIPCIERQILNHWTTRKSHEFRFSVILSLFTVLESYCIFPKCKNWKIAEKPDGKGRGGCEAPVVGLGGSTIHFVGVWLSEN